MKIETPFWSWNLLAEQGTSTKVQKHTQAHTQKHTQTLTHTPSLSLVKSNMTALRYEGKTLKMEHPYKPTNTLSLTTTQDHGFSPSVTQMFINSKCLQLLGTPLYRQYYRHHGQNCTLPFIIFGTRKKMGKEINIVKNGIRHMNTKSQK